MREPAAASSPALRVVAALDALCFLAACLLNFGARLGPLVFQQPVWQAGVGELVVGAMLAVAAASRRRRLLVAAFVLAAVGIVFGLASKRVVGLARDIHVVLFPLTLVGFVLLWVSTRGSRRR
jgi:hypothetical protein